MNQPLNTVSELSFEEVMQELQNLVRRLEEGRLALEEAITAYERGVALKNHCEAKLKAAKLKVEQIVVNDQGAVATIPFDEKSSV